MPIGAGIFGIVLSGALLFIAMIVFDAFETNVIDCSDFVNDTKSGCKNLITYMGIAFIIAPIAVLLDVIGILPIFGGRFSLR